MSVNQHAGKIARMGMTFGGFDLLHLGHINLLREAKARCKKLIVCVSSDSWLTSHKARVPLLSYEHRVHLVALTGYADIIDCQTLTGKKPLVDKYRPDMLFVGSDWDERTFVNCGLPVTYLPYTEGISTTWYRKKL